MCMSTQNHRKNKLVGEWFWKGPKNDCIKGETYLFWTILVQSSQVICISTRSSEWLVPPERSLLGSLFHDPRMPYVLESHPEWAAPLSRRDNERRHAVGSHSALTMPMYLAACNPSSSCHFWVLDHLQFVCIISLWINHGNPTLNLCVCFYLFLFCLCFSDSNAF